MTKKKQVAQGRRGQRGQRGAKGDRGERGLEGVAGPIGPPGIVPEKLASIEIELQRIRSDADVQFKRIAQLQAQLDVALAELARLARLRKG